MKINSIFSKVLATIAILLVVLISLYFLAAQNSFDWTWSHTYFPGSILFFCVFGLIGFFIQKKKHKKIPVFDFSKMVVYEEFDANDCGV